MGQATDKISLLPERNIQGHKDVVEILEDLLKQAKKGEIEAIAVASVKRDEYKDQVCANEYALGYDGHGFVLYTSIEVMRERLMRHFLG